MVLAGILSRTTESDLKDIQANQFHLIDVVVCNLYPFSAVIQKPDVTQADAIENIDIGNTKILIKCIKICDGDFKDLSRSLSS